MQEQCSVKDCNRPIGLKKHKLCRTHYMRYRKYGTPDEERPINVRKYIRPYKADSEKPNRLLEK